MSQQDDDLFDFGPKEEGGEGKVIASAPAASQVPENAAEAPTEGAMEVDLNAEAGEEGEGEEDGDEEGEGAPEPASTTAPKAANATAKSGGYVPPKKFLVDEPLEYDKATKLLALTFLPGPDQLVVIEGSSHKKPPILKSVHLKDLVLPGLMRDQLAALETILGIQVSALVAKKLVIAIMPDDGNSEGPLVSITALARPGDSLGAVPARLNQLQPLPPQIVGVLDQVRTKIGEAFEEARKKEAERLKQEEERKAKRGANKKGAKPATAEKPAPKVQVKPASAQTALFGDL